MKNNNFFDKILNNQEDDSLEKHQNENESTDDFTNIPNPISQDNFNPESSLNEENEETQEKSIYDKRRRGVGIYIQNTSEDNSIKHDISLGTISIGRSGPIKLNVDINKVPPMDITGHIEGGDKPVKVKVDNETFPELPIKLSELPEICHEFMQKFYIPSSYKIALDLYGKRVGAITIKGSTFIIPKEKLESKVSNDSIENRTQKANDNNVETK